MTQPEMITLLKTMLNNEPDITDEAAELYLSMAADKVMRRAYPYGANGAYTLPAEYEFLTVRLAARLYLRQGAEGEKSHNENGINRSYGSVNDEDILSEITPFVKVVG